MGRTKRSCEDATFVVDDLAGRIAAYSGVRAPRAERDRAPDHPAEAITLPRAPDPRADVREYPHPASDAVRVVPLLGTLDDRTLALLERVVDPGAQAPRRVVVLQLTAGTTVTSPALSALRHAHVRATAAGNWIVLVCADADVRAGLERLDVPVGPRIAVTNAEAMRLALDVVADTVASAG